MSQLFNKKTFDYFKAAYKNRNKKEWYEKNKAIYLDYVKEPFSGLIAKINHEFSTELPRIEISEKKIIRPYRRNFDSETGLIRAESALFLSEKATSMFETNPGIYISIGLTEDDNICGLGLYSVSSRQMSLLRNGIVENFEDLHNILSAKKLKSRMGSLAGEKFKRFPKGFSADREPAKYLWHKQFFLSKKLARKDIVSSKFQSEILKDIEAGIPFLKWIRKTVGTYSPNNERS